MPIFNLPDLDDLNYHAKMLENWLNSTKPEFAEQLKLLSVAEKTLLDEYYAKLIKEHIKYAYSSDGQVFAKWDEAQLKEQAYLQDEEKIYTSLADACALDSKGFRFKALLMQVAHSNYAENCLAKAIRQNNVPLLKEMLSINSFVQLAEIKYLLMGAVLAGANETFKYMHQYCTENGGYADVNPELFRGIISAAARVGNIELVDFMLPFLAEDEDYESYCNFVTACFESKNKDLISSMLVRPKFLDCVIDLCRRTKDFVKILARIDFDDAICSALAPAMLVIGSSASRVANFAHESARVDNVSALSFVYNTPQAHEKLTLNEDFGGSESGAVLEIAIENRAFKASRFMLETVGVINPEEIKNMAFALYEKSCIDSVDGLSPARMQILRALLRNKTICEGIAATEGFPHLGFFIHLQNHELLSAARASIDEEKFDILLAMVDEKHEYYHETLHLLAPAIIEYLNINSSFRELFVNGLQNRDFIAALVRLNNAELLDMCKAIIDNYEDKKDTAVKFISNLIDFANDNQDDFELKTKLTEIIASLLIHTYYVPVTDEHSDDYFTYKPEIFEILADGFSEGNIVESVLMHLPNIVSGDLKLAGFLQLQFIAELAKQYDMQPFSNQNIDLLECIVFHTINLTYALFEISDRSNWGEIGAAFDEFSIDSTNTATDIRIAQKLAFLNTWLAQKQAQAQAIQDVNHQILYLLTHPQARFDATRAQNPGDPDHISAADQFDFTPARNPADTEHSPASDQSGEPLLSGFKAVRQYWENLAKQAAQERERSQINRGNKPKNSKG